MRTKSILWAAMSMAAALVMTSCSSDDVQDWPTPTTKTIPYTVTVSQGTRATVDEDLSTLRFAEGDQLYIVDSKTGGQIVKGTIPIHSDDVGKTSATFEGGLDIPENMEDVPDDTQLTATLVSAEQSGTELTYPTNAYCATVDEAVQKYSKLTGTGTYGSQSFQLSQGTAFLNFTITFGYGVDTGTTLPAVVSNNDTELCRADVTTTTEYGKVVAKFVLPVASGTTLTDAKVTMGDKGSWTITDATLSGKVYNVTKALYAYAINANDKVLFAPGNLQATYDGSEWTWKFADHEWDYIGNAAGNTKVTTSEPYINGTGTVDLFTWVGASSSKEGVGKFGITSEGRYSSSVCAGHGNVKGEPMKAEWNSENLGLNRDIVGNYNWRTLTNAEWVYLITIRDGATVNGTAEARHTLGTINTDGTSVNGMILFPDGGTFASSEFTTLGTLNGANKYTTKCTTAQWSALALKGCVFLPAAGYRSSNNNDQVSVSDAGTAGHYWSTTSKPDHQGYSYDLIFAPYEDNGKFGNHEYRRNTGRSVRLVREVE